MSDTCFRPIMIPASSFRQKTFGKARISEHSWKGISILVSISCLALGQASGICPRIEASLRTSTPAGYRLDATGAYEFLYTEGIDTRAVGFWCDAACMVDAEGNEATPDGPGQRENTRRCRVSAGFLSTRSFNSIGK